MVAIHYCRISTISGFAVIIEFGALPIPGRVKQLNHYRVVLQPGFLLVDLSIIHFSRIGS